MEMSDFTWQHQKYARPEIYVVTYVHVKSNGQHIAHILIECALVYWLKELTDIYIAVSLMSYNFGYNWDMCIQDFKIKN